jgi:hypothetical protein
MLERGDADAPVRGTEPAVDECAPCWFVERVGGVEQAVDRGVAVAWLELLCGAEQLGQSCGVVVERVACGPAA